MGDLSRNFSRREFACRCGCGFDTPVPRLLDGLQALRDVAGASITINSGCRCANHNRRVGGASRSHHLAGEAADIVIAGRSPVQMATLADRVPAFRDGGVIAYRSRGFIHVDVRRGRYRATH